MRKIEIISQEIERENEFFRQHNFKMDREKSDLMIFANRIEEKISFYSSKLHEYNLFLKKEQLNEGIKMLDEEYLSFQFSRNYMISHKINYEELLRLLIIDTFSMKLNQNKLHQNSFFSANLHFYKYELYYVFERRKIIREIFKFLYDYVNDKIEYSEIESLINCILKELRLKETEEFIIILAKNIENLIIEKNYESFSKSTANFNLGKIVLFLEIVIKINYYELIIQNYENFLENEYDDQMNMLIIENNNIGSLKGDKKEYLNYNNHDNSLKELYSEHKRIKDLCQDIDSEIKRITNLKDTKLLNLKLEIDRIIEDNKRLHNSKNETCEYIDSQREIILNLYQKKKERLNLRYENLKTTDFNHKISNSYLVENISNNLNKFKLSNFSTNMKESLSKISNDKEINQNNFNVISSNKINSDYKNDVEKEKTPPIQPIQNNDNEFKETNEQNYSRNNKYINDYEMKKSTSKLLMTAKSFLGNLTTQRTDKRVEIFNVPRSNSKILLQRQVSKTDNEKITKPLQKEILTKDKFKLKVTINYEDCPNETFLKLEKLRPILEGFKVYKRANNINGKILNEFDPFLGREVNPESYGYSLYFMYLSKQVDKMILETLKEPSISLSLNLLNFHSIVVPKKTNVMLQIYKLNKKLVKNSKSFEDYLTINKKKIEKDEAISKIIFDIKLRNRVINKPYFMIYFIMKNETKIEIITDSYNEFKYILNCLNFLLNELQSLIPLSVRIDQIIE